MFLYICAVPHPTEQEKEKQLNNSLLRFPQIV